MRRHSDQPPRLAGGSFSGDRLAASRGGVIQAAGAEASLDRLRPAGRRRIAALTGLVDRALSRTLPMAQTAPRVIHEAMRYCVLSGGKRFRPLLCLGSCEAVGAPARRALPVACAVELIHTYSLVHDDLPAMDNADERRGQPACHRKFGEGNAILVGDALLTLAFEQLGGNGTNDPLAVIRAIGRACGTAGLVGGQVLDLQVISRPQIATAQALRDIARRKTAALIAASIEAGALAGGASGLQMKRLRRYGWAVGLAFQLLDDLRDGEGLARALGAEAARAEAQRLLARAVRALEPFGRRATLVRDLAVWLSTSA